MIFHITEEERSLFLTNYIKSTKNKEAGGRGISEKGLRREEKWTMRRGGQG